MKTESIFNSKGLEELLRSNSFLSEEFNINALAVRIELLKAHKFKVEAQCMPDDEFLDIEITLAESNRAFLQAIKILRGIDSYQKPELGCSCACNKENTAPPEHLQLLDNLLSLQVRHQTSQDGEQVAPVSEPVVVSADFSQSQWLYSHNGWM